MKPFISTADLGALLGQDVTTDPLAVIALDSSCEMIRTYLGQRLNYDASDTVLMGGSGGVAQLVPEMPIVAIAEILIDGTEETDYVFVRKSGLIYRRDGTVWPRGVDNISITYSHGYAILEIDVEDDPDDATPKPDRMPADIRRIALALAQRIFATTGTVVGQIASETISPDSYAYTLADSSTSGAAQAVIQPEEMFVLDFHRFAGAA